MNIEEVREYCLSLPYAEECTPFDEWTLVYKVGGKMFAYMGSIDFSRGVSMKCDPDRAIEFRERYPDEIMPGYHSSKKHWNTVITEGNLPEAFIKELIKDSYDLVVSKLPRSVRATLQGL